ncbi:uncharacterized protein LOC117490946 [Trematomus bernacchii]|uniref:uncharacterized protein LOC117490946 n=1 Tax=Trematomus bernacchii TaxID=40690 RepID=UPI00146D0DB5|nr:uncharacterized protein LOC117490946 [Trematomus bernacchii]
MAKKSTPWSIDEVTTFLHLIADDKIQRELDGTTRNLKVFQEVSALLSVRGYARTFQQCRDKLKKLKSEYRAVKDHNGRSGSDRRSWKWFDLMNDIYGRRPASVGREGGLDSATALLLSLHGKRKRGGDEHLAQEERHHVRNLDQVERNLAQVDRHWQLTMEATARAMQEEMALRREENAQTQAFNLAFLRTLGQVVDSRRGPSLQEDEPPL